MFFALLEASKKLRNILLINLRITPAEKKDGKTRFLINLAANRQLSCNGLFKTFLAIRDGDLFVTPMKLT